MSEEDGAFKSAQNGQDPPAEGDAGDDDVLLLAAIEYLRSYSETRRAQRLQVINYFVVSIAFLTAAYASALSNKLNILAGAIPILVACIAAVFWWSDRATRSYLHLTDEPLLILERRLASRLSVPGLNLTERSMTLAKTRRNSPSLLVTLMYLLAIIVATASAIIAFVR
jgi:hypothetical protein